MNNKVWFQLASTVSSLHTDVLLSLDEQQKERLCNRFINSLKSKEGPNEIEGDNTTRFRKKMSFPVGFIDALFSEDEDHKKEANENSPNATNAISEPVSSYLEEEMSLKPETGTHVDEEMFKVVKRLPRERKRSLIMSIFDRLVGFDNYDVMNAKLSNRPEEANSSDVMKNYEGLTVVKVSNYPDGIVINHLHESSDNVYSLTPSEESKSISNGRRLLKTQQSSQHKTVVNNQERIEIETPESDFGRDPVSREKPVGVENHGYYCNEAESEPSSPDQIVVINVDEVYASEVIQNSSQIHCAIASGTLMNSKTNLESSSPATPEPKTVRAWLKDLNLFKVITLIVFTP